MSAKSKKDMDKIKYFPASKLSGSVAKKKAQAEKTGKKQESIATMAQGQTEKQKKTGRKKSAEQVLKSVKSIPASGGNTPKMVGRTRRKAEMPEIAAVETIVSSQSKPKTSAEMKPAIKKPVGRSKSSSVAEKASIQRIVVERTLVKGLENLKEKVEAAKFFTPIRPVGEVTELQDLPKTYGVCRIVCLVRDPYWLHTYWEITDDRLHEAEQFFGNEWSRTITILRVYDVTGVSFNGENAKTQFDVELSGGAESWYINVNSPNTEFVIDILRVAPSGRIFVLARSNPVTTPRDGMSDILDEEWMNLDFDKMYALSGGFKIGATSAEMSEMMRQRLKSDISSWGGSGAVSSFGGSPVAVKRRGFWFMLDCELIVYGATEPDAKVTMQGHPVHLRPDGTFTVRFALPDGTQKIETTAKSADGVEERTITPTVGRNTESLSKILKEI